jgi:hypothetical protein
MKAWWALTIAICAALNCQAAAAYAQEADGQKFVKFDEPTFVNALSVLKGEKAHRIDAYGVFVNGNYAGQIGDTIRIAQQTSPHVNIVARTDGKVWTKVAAGRPSDGKLYGLVGLQLDLQSPQNIVCSDSTQTSCRDAFDVRRMGQTDVLIFNTNAWPAPGLDDTCLR